MEHFLKEHMKILEAAWEKRNLGIDVIEIDLDDNHMLSTDDVLSKVASLKKPGLLMIIKIPVASLLLLHVLEDMGFRFLECQFRISKSINDYEPPAETKPLLNKVSVRTIDKNDHELSSLLEKITPGMFSTDRICLDPLWNEKGKELSANRYKNWIKDIFYENNTTSYYVTLGSNVVAFGIASLNKKQKKVNLPLAGVYSEFQGRFAGIAFAHAPLELFKVGFNQISTSISSNNAPVCRLYGYFGYQLMGMKYVLRMMSD